MSSATGTVGIGGRSSFLDNAKGLLIALVVLGHVMQLTLTHAQPGQALYLLIYSFHMPAFAALTGYLSRPDVGTAKGRRRFLRLLAVLVFFQALHVLLEYGIVGWVDIDRAFEYPQYTLWWLVAVLFWTLLLPLFAGTESTSGAIRGLAVAVAIAVASGWVLDDGGSFSLSRTFVFLPFFVGGYYAARHGWRMPRSRGLRVAAILAFAALGAALVLASLDFAVWQDWLQARLTYRHYDLARWKEPIVRLGLLATSATMVLAFLQLVPRRRLALITALGATTLSVYVWHAIAVSALRQLGFSGLVAGDWPRALALTIALVAVAGYGPLARLTVALLGGKMRSRLREAAIGAEPPAPAQRSAQRSG